jgi:hypothetical protein
MSEFMSLKVNDLDLGEYTFPHHPDNPITVRKTRSVISTPTVTSSSLDDYGFLDVSDGLIGTEWQLTWPMMAPGFFNALRSYYEHDPRGEGTGADPVIWNPGVRSRRDGETYEVVITSLSSDGGIHRLADYYVNVSIIFNIRAISELGAAPLESLYAISSSGVVAPTVIQ